MILINKFLIIVLLVLINLNYYKKENNENNISIFTNIYENNVWGNNGENKYNGSSGDGSTINYNLPKYIPFVIDFIKNNNIKKIVDLGCGDWQSSHLIYNNLDVDYVGYDAYKKIIDNNNKKFSKYKFINLDFINDKEKIENGDLCIIKDVLQHLCKDDIISLLDYLVYNKKFKHILVINCCIGANENIDIKNGDFRPLSILQYPLNKYNGKKLINYNTKEISVINIF